MKKVEIIHLSTYIQPGGVKIQIRGLKIKKGLNGYPFTAQRLVNGQEQEWWLGWDLMTVAKVLKDWLAFEKKIGSQLGGN